MADGKNYPKKNQDDESIEPFKDYEDLKDIPAKVINDVCEKYGKKFKSISVNQIRNIFSHFSQIREKFKKLPKKYPEKTKEEDREKNDKLMEDIYRELILTKPIIAYVPGKETNINRKKDLMLLKDFFFHILSKVSKNWLSYSSFFTIIESFVGYHKFYEEKKN